MNVLLLLVPLAILLAAIAVAGFSWAVRDGQFEDVKTPAIRILFDETELPHSEDTRVEET
jgi:cbb3-type cytochrome oxidase maturation protein